MVNQKNVGKIQQTSEGGTPSDNLSYTPGTLDVILRELLRPIVQEILDQEKEARKKEQNEDREKSKEAKYYTRDEVCEKLNICKATFHNWINDGKLTKRKIGGRVYIDAESLERSMKEGEIKKFTKFRIKPLKK